MVQMLEYICLDNFETIEWIFCQWELKLQNADNNYQTDMLAYPLFQESVNFVGTMMCCGHNGYDAWISIHKLL